MCVMSDAHEIGSNSWGIIQPCNRLAALDQLVLHHWMAWLTPHLNRSHQHDEVTTCHVCNKDRALGLPRAAAAAAAATATAVSRRVRVRHDEPKRERNNRDAESSELQAAVHPEPARVDLQGEGSRERSRGTQGGNTEFSYNHNMVTVCQPFEGRGYRIEIMFVMGTFEPNRTLSFPSPYTEHLHSGVCFNHCG